MNIGEIVFLEYSDVCIINANENTIIKVIDANNNIHNLVVIKGRAYTDIIFEDNIGERLVYPVKLELAHESVNIKLSDTSVYSVNYVFPGDTSLDELFKDCSYLKTVHERSFTAIANHNPISMVETFANCVKFDLNAHTELFNPLISVTHLISTFKNTGVLYLDKNSLSFGKLEYCVSTFADSSNLRVVKQNVFDFHSSTIVGLDFCFFNTRLNTISNKVFKLNNLQSAKHAISGMPNLKLDKNFYSLDIPLDLEKESMVHELVDGTLYKYK